MLNRYSIGAAAVQRSLAVLFMSILFNLCMSSLTSCRDIYLSFSCLFGDN